MGNPVKGFRASWGRHELSEANQSTCIEGGLFKKSRGLHRDGLLRFAQLMKDRRFAPILHPIALEPPRFRLAENWFFGQEG
jgi:hypothetical protein